MGLTVKEYVNHILDIARGRNVECEVFAEDSRGLEIEAHRGRAESIERYRDRGIGIRLVDGGRSGYAFSSDLSPSALESAFEEAAASAAAGSSAGELILADYHQMQREPDLSERAESDAGKMTERVLEMEKEALGFSGEVINTRNAGYSEGWTRVTVGSTRGFIREEYRGCCSCFISAIAKRGDEVRSGGFWYQSPEPEGIDFRMAGREAAARAVGLLGSRKIRGGRMPALFESYAFIDMLGFLEDIVSAEMVNKGMSCLAGKLNRRVAPDYVTIVDDPALEGGCGNSVFDDEGVPTSRIELVGSGILQNYFHTSSTARKMGSGRPGNAVRPSFKAIPQPGATNLYLEPGGRKMDHIIAGIDRGVLIQNIMGIHTADTISGDFSLGFNGHYISSGRREHPLCEMTVAGSILELLAGIAEIGSGLRFIGETGSPPVLVTGLSISGE